MDTFRDEDVENVAPGVPVLLIVGKAVGNKIVHLRREVLLVL